MRRGELVIGVGFALLGVLWIVKSLELDYMGEFAPGSGFVPFWTGLLLALMSAYFVLVRARSPEPVRADGVTEEPGSWRRPAAVALGLMVCVATIDALGFLLAAALYLVFLLRIVEGRSWATTLGVGIGAPVAMFLLFKQWLGIPLPTGPLGI